MQDDWSVVGTESAQETAASRDGTDVLEDMLNDFREFLDTKVRPLDLPVRQGLVQAIDRLELVLEHGKCILEGMKKRLIPDQHE
ncbi:hypothetical protein PSACC_01496 [Paramicrosporidium saccamoebae]|uniref:Uncharacterized protein n=1 Tax=Paramicrosporidium saccamoebae TaxID=1246581 RepID=A0A2H9TLU1_9FUNG|nr:hypothetical protein PSACC_01496 [Paramicrosporidium saccamoebae]